MEQPNVLCILQNQVDFQAGGKRAVRDEGNDFQRAPSLPVPSAHSARTAQSTHSTALAADRTISYSDSIFPIISSTSFVRRSHIPLLGRHVSANSVLVFVSFPCENYSLSAPRMLTANFNFTLFVISAISIPRMTFVLFRSRNARTHKFN